MSESRVPGGELDEESDIGNLHEQVQRLKREARSKKRRKVTKKDESRESGANTVNVAVTESQHNQAGVNIEAGDSFSQFAGKLAFSTYKNSSFVDVCDLSQGNFRGPRGFALKNVPAGCVLTLAPDGVGTKSVIIDAAQNYVNAASNLIAMTAMDITRYGGLPLVFTNVLDVKCLGRPDTRQFEACKQLMVGLVKVCNEHNYVLLNGETAELGACVSSENPDAQVHFNWAGVMLGIYHPDKMILGNTLKPGQIVMALKDDFRSNGLSLVRRALTKKYASSIDHAFASDGGDAELRWWNNPAALVDIQSCATSAVQYDTALSTLHGWYRKTRTMSDGNEASVTLEILQPLIRMHLIVHLSGGAIESKFAHDLLAPQGLSATLDTLFDPPKIMQDCAKWAEVTPAECYSAWNGGQGALVVIDPDAERYFIDFMKQYGIDAKKAGYITEKQDYTVKLTPKFGYGLKKGDVVYY